jgi:hypothetical protein
VDEELLISRSELTAYLFTVADIRQDVARIREILAEEDDGGGTEEDA